MTNNENKAVILVVDDKQANILALQSLLEKEDRVFLSATNGKDALQLALTHELDLIMLDVNMPDMDGFEVAQILKSNKRTKDIPIIFATAEQKGHQSMLKALEEGAVDYLFKPLDPEITKAKVSVLLKIQLQRKQIYQLNIDLQKSISQLKEANKELESFTYSVSHDLRAPLRALMGFSNILETEHSGTFNTEALRLVKNIQRNSVRMGRLIDDLLSFSRLGRKEVQKRQVDMNVLVKTVLEDLNVAMPNTAEVKVGELHPARADHSLMIHVFTNLLSNAIKYSRNKPNPVVTVNSEINDDNIIYSISDNGAGFDMKYAHNLFGVFQRLHSENEFEGTGVGLAIVKRIITRHGGEIWAKAESEKGATFYFSLPL